MLGSVHWITDPDPAILVSGFQDANKSLFFQSFLLFTYCRYRTLSLNSHKAVEVKVFVNITSSGVDPDRFRIEWGPRIRIRIRIRYLDPDPGGQK